VNKTKTEKQYDIVVYEWSDGNSEPKEVKRLGPMSERRAERVENGMQPNLDHGKFFTRVEEAKP
jgi:hypothetical protein